MAGLVLDDALAEIRNLRKFFHLPRPDFGLEQIEGEAKAKEVLNKIIKGSRERHDTKIYSKKDPLLEDLGSEIYAEEIRIPSFYSGWRLSTSHVERTLRRVFEAGLQTLAQLPTRDPTVPRTRDEMVSLGSQFDKLAKKADAALRADSRIGVYFGSTRHPDSARLLGLPAELRWGAETLKAVASGTRRVRVSLDSPNPQVRFALYLAGWIEACTGKKHYQHVRTLSAAAFAAAGVRREPPAWVDRLEIEMNRKMKKRRRWSKMISV